MKILRFMHAAYQTIRLNSLIISQKSVFKYSKNWLSFGPKTSKICLNFFFLQYSTFGSFCHNSASFQKFSKRIFAWLSVNTGGSFDILHAWIWKFSFFDFYSDHVIFKVQFCLDRFYLISLRNSFPFPMCHGG